MGSDGCIDAFALLETTCRSRVGFEQGKATEEVRTSVAGAAL
jgi:hypothetical protein